MNGLSQLFQSLGSVRIIILGVVAVGLIGLIMLMANRITTPDYALLYGGLEPSDSSSIVNRLEADKIPYQIKNDGRDILIPQDQVARMRLGMAEVGLPNGGSVGYEIFDSSDTFGTTSFVQNVNFIRALEGELASRSGFERAGPFRQMGYNSPFMPERDRFYELQLPVSSAAGR